MIWVVFVAMTIAAAAATLWPLALARPRATGASGEAEFYRAQLAEVERDVERGALPQGEAAAA
jgi:cytochrome c-type biogenesis protein CcmH